MTVQLLCRPELKIFPNRQRSKEAPKENQFIGEWVKLVRAINRSGRGARGQDGSSVLSHAEHWDLKADGKWGSRKRFRDLTPVPYPLDEELELAQGTANRLRGRFGSGLEAQIFLSGAGRRWRLGSMPQISLAYWAMVRSLENLPEVAMFRITIRVHSLGFYKPKGS